MNLKDKMEQFNKRWEIISAESYAESFQKFKVRILNILRDIDQHVTKESIADFCQYCGIEENRSTFGLGSQGTNIIRQLRTEEDEVKFYKLIELIFSLDINPVVADYGGWVHYKDILFKKVSEAIELSNVNLAIMVSNNEIILYPKGEKILDEELVNSPLSFLNKVSSEHFVQALKFCQSKNHIKSAESLRRSLEEFLRYKLKTTKGLDTNITELQKILKSDGRAAQARNIMGLTFKYLDQYFNENSKHNDGDINDSENEFLIYQTGLLMRYTNKNIEN